MKIGVFAARLESHLRKQTMRRSLTAAGLSLLSEFKKTLLSFEANNSSFEICMKAMSDFQAKLNDVNTEASYVFTRSSFWLEIGEPFWKNFSTQLSPMYEGLEDVIKYFCNLIEILASNDSFAEKPHYEYELMRLNQACQLLVGHIAAELGKEDSESMPTSAELSKGSQLAVSELT